MLKTLTNTKNLAKFLKQPAIRSFYASKKTLGNTVDEFAKMIEEQVPGKNVPLPSVLEAVYNNEKITAVCPDLAIRLASLRATVARRAWELKGKNPEDIQNLSIGSIDVPNIPGYKEYLREWHERSCNLLLAQKNFRIMYDLLAQGDYESRKAILTKMNKHYGFSEETIELMAQNSAVNAGVRGLKDTADSLIFNAKRNGHIHQFIQPDNSFPTWFAAIEKQFNEEADNLRRGVHIIGTDPKNKLHISAKDVEKFYKEHKPTPHESWYITPVGNPSGTKVRSSDLQECCEAILDHNPKAIIMMDIVYSRTLTMSDAKKMFSGIANNDRVLNNAYFLESFSKSHGLCRERLAITFTKNPELFKKCHEATIGFSAGDAQFKNFQLMALAQMPDDKEAAIRNMHVFWANERYGLYKYLMNHPKAKDLFEENQEHIDMQDLKGPCGLYVLLKVKPGITGKDVLIQTGALGVEVKLASGTYIRFSVGTVTKPTFSKK